MTLSQRLEKIKENWVAIVISLLAAISLYFFYQINQLESINLSIPLTVESEGNLLVVGKVPENIKITIKGKPEDISKITSKDISGKLNLNYYYDPGTYVVPVDLKISKTIEQMNTVEIKVKPETISVNLEEKIVKYVPILVKTYGNPASGFEITNIETNPKMVRIVGPSSVISRVRNIETNGIDITDLDSDYEKSTYFVNVNKLFSIDEENSCDVKIEISPIIIEKTFEDVDISMINLDKVFESSLKTKKANITLEGAQNKLENYKLPYGNFYVDCSKITEPGEYELEIKHHKLGNFAVTNIAPQRVHVIVTQKVEELPEENQNQETPESQDNIEITENQEPKEN